MRLSCEIATALLLAALPVLASQPAAEEKPLFGGAVYRQVGEAAEPPSLGLSTVSLERESLTRLRLIERESRGAVRAWRYLSDRREMEILLHEDLHDLAGHQLSAHQVVASLTRLLRQRPESAAAGILLDLEGAEAYVNGEAESVSGLEVIDSVTLRVRLVREQPLLIDALRDLAASPETVAADLGPFLGSGEGGYVPNLAYRGGRPFIDQLFFGVRPGSTEDWRRPVVAAVGDTPASAQDAVFLSYPGSRCVYLAANRRRGVGALAIAEVRHSCFAAIGVEEMVNIFLSEQAQVLEHLVPDSSVPASVFSDEAVASGTMKPVGRLAIGYPAGSDELRLVAARLKVDLLVVGIAADLVACDAKSAADCDLLLVERLVPDAAPAYAVWGLLCDLALFCDDAGWRRRPQLDAFGWLADLERQLRAEALLLPLYREPHGAWADRRLRGLRFRDDGTLDFEDAWIAAGEEESY